MENMKVLFVDDEEELVTTLVERLEYRNIKADYSLEGLDALMKMRENEYDVVVLDLKLPGMDGVEVLGRIKKEHPDIPVLLITGHGSPIGEPDEKPDGAFDYLPKPIQLETLIAKLKEAVSHHE